ncbi:extracellular solute-binding protein [Betaproteobacteria bacterium PRO7]|jgi:ABC-type Fe3+ transport system substrate-binding protein|nr:extracellular solute-binding protein [Betaproteobacteria bacterium PRO7]
MPRTPIRALLAAAAWAVAAPALAQQTVTVITSFPRELTAAYKSAFEKRNPDVKLEILNKSTVAGIAFVRETAAGQRPDVFWASAPDAFEVLKRDNLLVAAADVDNPKIPAKIGNYPINDPKGFYKGQALAGYGIMYNTRYLKANKLNAPKEWNDLLGREWFGHVAMTSPSRSGTMHLTVETILQGEGWDKGWETILRMAGNSAQITERSFGVPDGINNGQFGAGPVIDFFGLAGKYSGFPVEFVYPTMTSIVPANIALVAGGKNLAGAKRFVQFALSQEGQELLLDPKISRLPVLPYSAFGGKIPAGYPDPQAIAKRSKVQFNADLSEDRYAIVQALFDQTITFRLKELQAATRAIHDAEAKLAGKSNAQARELLNQAKALAYSPVLSGQIAGQPDFQKLFASNKKEVDVSRKITVLEEQWNSKARANYQRALELAQQAAAAVK